MIKSYNDVIDDMERVTLQPRLRSNMKRIGEYYDFLLFEYTPSLFKAFAINMDEHSVAHRLRCVEEFFCGYKVFYINYKGKWAGYCIVTNGRNPRYSFCNKKDITFGRYYVDDLYRGMGLGKKMVETVLNLPDLKYDNAYAYVHESNVASHSIMKSIGCKLVDRFNMVGVFRRIKMNKDGNYYLYCVEKKDLIKFVDDREQR